MPNGAGDSRGRFASVLAHPASLLVLTAVLTGLLAPWITNRWEQRERNIEAQRAASERRTEARRIATQKELELKAAIVTHIGTASARFLSAAETGVINGASGPQAQAEYHALKQASLEIGAQLAAYFPKSQPLESWRNYTFSLRNTYLLLSAPVGRRNHWLDRLNFYLDQAPTQLDGLCLGSTNPSFVTALRLLVVELQDKQEEIVRAVVASDSRLTGTPVPPSRVERKHYDAAHPRPCG
jgi:hypothetical protein